MSELESVQRDPDGRVFSVGVEGRALYYLPRVIAELDELRAENGRLRLMVADTEGVILRKQEDVDELASELAAARRVVQAVKARDWHRADALAAALGGPGPTPEPPERPMCAHAAYGPHLLATGGNPPLIRCPGPTDDERPATEAQR